MLLKPETKCLVPVLKDTETNRQVYPVELWYNRVEFTLLQLTANMGGFVSILSALYLLLFGTRRVESSGGVQRYVSNTVSLVPFISDDHDLGKTDEIGPSNSLDVPLPLHRSRATSLRDPQEKPANAAGGVIFQEPPTSSADPSERTFDTPPGANGA
jgi:hypothetical protein